MTEVFNGYELLVLKCFQANPDLWMSWRNKLHDYNDKEKGENKMAHIMNVIPQNLWFLSVMLIQRPKLLIQLAKVERETKHTWKSDTLMTRYINSHHFTELHLDSIFKYGDDNSLPKEIFKCEHVRYMSLKYNCLYDLPPDIGRLAKLEYLALTNNRLHVQSIPYTLTFCTRLKTILLDNNLLDALPGFLLEMPSIETVHRHGNHNYFKSTFMWYHTDVQYRINLLSGNNGYSRDGVSSLAFWCAKTLIGSKRNFFTDPSVAGVLRDYVCDLYEQFNVCHNCNTAKVINEPGWKVITFKNPYLGNTCVPFQHWACSVECARSLEVPARIEQIAKDKEIDARYDHYITECQQRFRSGKRDKMLISNVPRERQLYVCDWDMFNMEMPRRSSHRHCVIV